MERNLRKTRVGIVTSDKMDKTVVVKVERRVMHPIYKKFIRRSKKYAAHDELNQFKVGDVVRIRECVPFSKTKLGKCWLMPVNRESRGFIP